MSKIRCLITFLIIGMFLFSCDKQKLDKNALKDSSNFITELQASSISENLFFKGGKFKAFSQPERNEVSEFFPVKDENADVVFYIINYLNGGFLILSADNRVSPVLAYSGTGEFRTNAPSYPSGLVKWLTRVKEKIKYIRKQGDEQSQEIKEEWNDITTHKIELNPTNCEDEYEEVGPLLTTTWNQQCGFNESLQSMSCGPCGHVYAGCVPIAIAQVMKYHNYPTSYNWTNMPNTYGTTTTANLIKDIHDSFVTNFMGQTIPTISYDCEGTGVSHDYDIASVFTTHFNYSSASNDGYNRDKIKNELRNNRPLLLSGGRDDGWWIFHSYTDGHMWVCDGFRRAYNWSEDCSMAWSYLFLHMNWGWLYGSENGWYSFNDFTPGDYSFNYDVKMVYNIEP